MMSDSQPATRRTISLVLMWSSRTEEDGMCRIVAQSFSFVELVPGPTGFWNSVDM
jgi:hypothetical protein